MTSKRPIRQRRFSPPCLPLNSESSEMSVEDRSNYLDSREKSMLRNTSSNTMNTSTRNGSTIIAVMEGRGNLDGRLGLAQQDVRYPEIEFCEFVDSREYSRLKTMIQVADAYEVVIPQVIEEKGSTKLLGEALTAAFPDLKITVIHMRHFNSRRGVEMAQLLANKEVSSFDESSLEKSLAMAAFSTLTKYVQETRVVHFLKESLRIRDIPIENTCMIDFASWDSLELLDSQQPARRTGRKERRSLLSVINHTLTVNGARLLRSNLLQPSADVQLIEDRLDAVEQLRSMPQVLEKLRLLLSRAHELDTIMAMCIQSSSSWTVQSSEANVNQIIKLFQTLQVLDAIRDVLDIKEVTCVILRAKVKYLSDPRFIKMLNILETRIELKKISGKKNSLAIRNLTCLAVREGVSVNLDVARKAYTELIAKVDEVSEELKIYLPDQPTARISYSNVRRFHYTLVNKDISSIILPPYFTDVIRHRSSITFSSRALTIMNDRITCAVSEVMLASDVVVFDLIEIIRPLLPVLYYAMDALSTIDFLYSIATYANLRNAVRPRFGDCFAVSQGRHPTLDWAKQGNIVTNDACLTRECRFALITGPNMAGKSTYLKQMAQLCILGLSGCPIPAASAVLPVLKRIFSRIGHNDSIHRNKSAFAMEMSDAASIMHNADESSLVILDELARSTSTEEGIAISYAISEKIIALKCFTFFATHFLDLAVLEHRYTEVEKYRLQIIYP
ncbi:unnamed protein product [Caenorhabditis auriculariae]|uniref:DNA mismatch repair proteins mutS family domain-containing protein n=1 Tax=Caenorhabditis auriculariae TaxID=2777116 RepID=A0A8S1HIN9_9PELO|nr:unnamed protein product [Caenorhabditis auriculariae]